MSFISLSKRFKTKSNLLRIIFFLITASEFHFHGIKSLRFLKIPKVFCTYFLSIIRNFWVEFSIKGTSFLRSVIEIIKNINYSLFNFSSNTYSNALVFSVPKFQVQTGEGLTRIRNFRSTYFSIDVAGSKNIVMTSSNGITWTSRIQFDYFFNSLKISKTFTF